MRRLSILAAATLLAVASAALGDTIAGSTNATWQTWQVSDLNQNGKPYWDHTSWDGSDYNLGFCLTGLGNCTQLGTSAPGSIPFWGTKFVASTDQGGKADPDIYFDHSGGGTQAAVELTVAGNAGFNEFGWYDASVSNPVCQVLFNGGGPGDTAFFTPTAQYGFCLIGKDSPDHTLGEWFTQAGDNTEGKGDQHFAIFDGGNSSYWIGVEDLPFGNTDRDFNDLIIHVTPAATPEPGSLALLGSGLLALGGILRRKLR